MPTPELKALVAQAEEELARVSQITTHTLRFHRQSSHSTDLDIEKLFHSVVALYRARLRNSSITAVIDRCDAKDLRCHEGELRQIVLNIIANAVDAMKHGGVLSLRCRESTNWATGQTGVRLIIADNGTGMDAGILARMFEPFFSTKGIGGPAWVYGSPRIWWKRTAERCGFEAQRARAHMGLPSASSFRIRRKADQALRRV
jgi:signal transduction histidine kinase